MVNMPALLALLRLIDVFIDSQTFSVPKIMTYPTMKFNFWKVLVRGLSDEMLSW